MDCGSSPRAWEFLHGVSNMPRLWTRNLLATCLIACSSQLPARTITITDHSGKRWILAARSNDAPEGLTLEPNSERELTLADQGVFDFDLSTVDGTSAFRLTVDNTREELTQTVSRWPARGGMPWQLYLDWDRGTVSITSVLAPDPAAFRKSGSEAQAEIETYLIIGNARSLISQESGNTSNLQPGTEVAGRTTDTTELDMDCSED